MDSHRGSQFVRGAFFLTLAGLISKILSAAYRIPLQNLTGDLGFYIYQQVYPFLGMMMILSLYGFPSAIAKIIGELQRKGKRISIHTTYGPLFFILFTCISFISVLLLFHAEMIANWMNDHRLTSAYKWVAVVFITIPFTSMLRGIFQGHQKFAAIAYSQVGEQIVRVLIIMSAAMFITTGHLHVYQMGTFGVIASLLGGMTAICILLIASRNHSFVQAASYSIPWRYYIKTLFMFGIVASLNHMVLLIIQFADVFTFVPQMMKFGLSQVNAMEAKGIFDRGQPLIQLGTVLGSSFALALVPTIVKEKLTDSIPSIRSSVKLSFYLAIGAMIGLIFIFEETNVLLYQDVKGTSSLQVLSIAIFLSSLSITCIAVLQSLGYFRRTGIFIIGTFVMKWVFNTTLIPHMGMKGAAIATVGSLSLLLIITLLELRRNVPGLHLLTHIHFRPFVIAIISMITLLFMMKILLPYTAITSRFSLLIYVVVKVCVGALIYLVTLIRFGAFSEREIEMLPFAPILLQIYKGRD